MISEIEQLHSDSTKAFNHFYFEIGYCRKTDFCVHVCTDVIDEDLNRKVLSLKQGTELIEELSATMQDYASISPEIDEHTKCLEQAIYDLIDINPFVKIYISKRGMENWKAEIINNEKTDWLTSAHLVDLIALIDEFAKKTMA
jgi:hypothetical protein